MKAFKSLKDIKKIHQIESLLLPADTLAERKVMLTKLSGAWNKEEAAEMKKVIKEGCERVDENEW
ncbi:MAG: hypothetical protein AAGA02_14610 [Bacteroidota bacterium]